MANFLPSRPRQIGSRRTFAIVASQYHQELVKGLVDHVRSELAIIAPSSSIHSYEVPGAFEIPLVVQEVAIAGGVDGIIALGVIIQGATAHGRLIAESVTEALQRTALQYHIPVTHEVLLVENEEQARERCLDEMLNRGTEAARVATRMAQVMSELARR